MTWLWSFIFSINFKNVVAYVSFLTENQVRHCKRWKIRQIKRKHHLSKNDQVWNITILSRFWSTKVHTIIFFKIWMYVLLYRYSQKQFLMCFEFLNLFFGSQIWKFMKVSGNLWFFLYFGFSFTISKLYFCQKVFEAILYSHWPSIIVDIIMRICCNLRKLAPILRLDMRLWSKWENYSEPSASRNLISLFFSIVKI